MRAKAETLCYIAYTSLKVSSREDEYFDIGCCRHITREKNHLKDTKSYFSSYVTFTDGAKGKIIGKGKLDYHGLPCLIDVLLVKGLNANLIGIS